MSLITLDRGTVILERVEKSLASATQMLIDLKTPSNVVWLQLDDSVQ